MKNDLGNDGTTHEVRRYQWILLALCALLWSWTAGFWDLWGPDEARYVQIAKELLGRHDWFNLTVFGEPYDQKPPLPFWILAGMLKLSGGAVSSWALRLPSLLFATLTVQLCFMIGRHLFGVRAGFLAALVLLSSGQFLDDAPTAELNMMFTGMLVLALYPWMTRPAGRSLTPRQALLMWGALAGAFFIKGPLALVIVLSPIAFEAAVQKSWRPVSQARCGAGLRFIFCMIVFWMFVQMHEQGTAFVWSQIREQTVERVLHGDHQEAFWYYIPRLFTSIFVPWGILLIPCGVLIFRQRRDLPRGLLPILGWVIPPFILFMLASGKRHSYLLPLMPGMALLVGWYLDRLIAEGRRFPRISLGLSAFSGLSGLALIAVALTAALRMDLFWNRSFFILYFGMAMFAATGVGFTLVAVYLLLRRQVGLAPVYAVVAAALMLGLLRYTALNPALNPEKSTRAFSAQIERLRQGNRAGGDVLAFKRAAKPEYHVNGSYAVRTEDSLEAMLHADAAATGLLLIRDQDFTKNNAETLLTAAGYHEVYQGEVSKDRFRIYAAGQPHAPAQNGPNLHIALVGDTAYDQKTAGQVADQIARLHDAQPLNSLMLLGDNMEDEGDGYQLSLQKQFLDPFQAVLKRNIPVYAVMGNHDLEDRHDEAEIKSDVFNMQGQNYYTRTFGDTVTFFMLDSNTLPQDPEQLLWFRDAVRASHSRWKILLLHHALLASHIAHGPSELRYRLLLPIMKGTHDVDVVIAGHNHLYERREPQHGIVHVTSGNGCKTVHDPLPIDPKRVAGSTDKLGFITLRFVRDQLEVKAIDEHGQTYDHAIYVDEEDPPQMREIAMRQ